MVIGWEIGIDRGHESVVIPSTLNRESIEDIDAPFFSGNEGYHHGWIPQGGINQSTVVIA